jgi:hypothetical protein
MQVQNSTRIPLEQWHVLKAVQADTGMSFGTVLEIVLAAGLAAIASAGIAGLVSEATKAEAKQTSKPLSAA